MKSIKQQIKEYSAREILFLAVLAAAMLLFGMITMPLVMSNNLFGLRNLVVALPYSLISVIALMKVPRPGALFLLALFHSAVLTFMSPVMLFNNVFASILAEIITLLIFKSYTTETSILLSATLFIPFTLPFSIIFGMLLKGRSLQEIIERPLLSLLLCILTIAISYLGALLGLKIGKELKKAGKLK